MLTETLSIRKHTDSNDASGHPFANANINYDPHIPGSRTEAITRLFRSLIGSFTSDSLNLEAGTVTSPKPYSPEDLYVQYSYSTLTS